MERRFKETDSAWLREELGALPDHAACEACHGRRLKPEALAVKIDGKHISEVSELSIRDARDWFGALPKNLTRSSSEIAARILKEINERLGFLRRRRARISDARARLRHAFGRREPAHPPRLADRLGPDRRALCARRAVDRPASARQRPAARDARAPARSRQHGDRRRARRRRDPQPPITSIDIGPGAGIHGGKIIAEGTPAEDIVEGRESITGDYLTGGAASRCRRSAAPANSAQRLKIVGARGNNLKNIDARLPLGTFTCVTGVSGGGKSTLVIDTLYKALARKLNGAHDAPGAASTASRASSISTRSSTSTNRRSAARRAPTPRPIPAPSRRSATGSPACRKPKRAATSRAASRST